MSHGVQAYFAERARNDRRVTFGSLTVGLVLLGALWAVGLPAVRRRLPVLDARRFGFEGREQYARRIILESMGPLQMHPGPELTMIRERTVKGGIKTPAHSTSTHAEPETRERRQGPGDAPEDLLAMARTLYRSAPVIQSEDLIIERLVKPEYPEEARTHDIEGKVVVIALVDTTGHISTVDVMASSGERLLEQAATQAVWQCLFRPYKIQGQVREVYAVFRFAFRIY